MDFNTESNSGGASHSSGRDDAADERPADSYTEEFTYREPVLSFVLVVMDLIGRPNKFYANIARSGDFLNPLLFAVTCTEISVVMSGGLAVFAAAPGTTERSVGAAVVMLAITLILAPIFLVVSLFVSSGITLRSRL